MSFWASYALAVPVFNAKRLEASKALPWAGALGGFGFLEQEEGFGVSFVMASTKVNIVAVSTVFVWHLCRLDELSIGWMARLTMPC